MGSAGNGVRLEWHCRVFSALREGEPIDSMRGLTDRAHARSSIPPGFRGDFGIHASVNTRLDLARGPSLVYYSRAEAFLGFGTVVSRL